MFRQNQKIKKWGSEQLEAGDGAILELRDEELESVSGGQKGNCQHHCHHSTGVPGAGSPVPSPMPSRRVTPSWWARGYY